MLDRAAVRRRWRVRASCPAGLPDRGWPVSGGHRARNLAASASRADGRRSGLAGGIPWCCVVRKLTGIIGEAAFPQQEEAHGVLAVLLHQRKGVDHVAEALAHFLPLTRAGATWHTCRKRISPRALPIANSCTGTYLDSPVRVGDDPPRQRQLRRHQKRGPVHAVKAQNVLADHLVRRREPVPPEAPM